jgi:tetratricopeptide (TPR) repeat protein
VHKVIEEIRMKNPAELKDVADTWLVCALAERNEPEAAAAITALGDNAFGDDAVLFSARFCQGLIARMTNEKAKAQAAFAAARVEQQKVVQEQPNYGPALCILGVIDAGLGRKEEALREGRRAIELLPVSKDSINGAHMIEYFAIIAAWVGEKDLACEQLPAAVPTTGTVNYGRLKLLPWWDPLRGDPRFEKIVASLAPKQ